MSKEPKLEVVTDVDDIIGCNIVVCAPAPDNQPLILPDNVMDWCARCGCKVQHRPDIPPGPERVCTPCAQPEIEAELAKGEEVTFMVTPKTIRDVKEWLRKQRKE